MSWYEEDYETKMINNVSYVKDLYKNQKNKVKQEQYIEKLLFEDYINSIKSITSRYDCLDDVFPKAQEEFGNRLKKERPNYECIKTNIMFDFLSNDKNFKMKEIMSCGYDRYGWEVVFEGYKKICRIFIPIRKKLTTDNIHYAHDGMFSFAIEESKHFWKVLKESYKTKDIEDFIKEYFKEKQ